MKAGDIVAVHDGSWSLSVIKGSLEHASGNTLVGRLFRVLSTDGEYPTDDRYDNVKRNDIMLIDTKDPHYLLFIRQAHCRVVTPLPSPPDTVDLAIPPGVTTVKLHFEH